MIYMNAAENEEKFELSGNHFEKAWRYIENIEPEDNIGTNAKPTDQEVTIFVTIPYLKSSNPLFH